MNPISRSQESFKGKVLAVTQKIPLGGTLTYKQVAARAGNPRACRAVGNILRANHDPGIPCHRVVRSDGQLGGYNRGVDKKRELLAAEGVLARAPRSVFRAGER